ncbi:MAG: hypothetical protein R2711_12250 [Acidimicrobiales bacterium]
MAVELGRVGPTRRSIASAAHRGPRRSASWPGRCAAPRWGWPRAAPGGAVVRRPARSGGRRRRCPRRARVGPSPPLAPHRALAALERLGGAAPAGVAVAELPDLDDRERLVLARRLLDEGAIELGPPPPSPEP